jgi:hypothetical protein
MVIYMGDDDKPLTPEYIHALSTLMGFPRQTG